MTKVYENISIVEKTSQSTQTYTFNDITQAKAFLKRRFKSQVQRDQVSSNPV